MKKVSLAFACACVAFVATNGAFAFADDDARKAILDLREKVAMGQNAQLQLSGQIEELREQNAALVGRLEKLTNELSHQQRSVRDLFSNLDKRVAAFEPRVEKGDGDDTFTVSAEEKRLYEVALKLFAEGRYYDSYRLLDTLIVEYPTTGYMPVALYWKGCTQFALNRLDDSIRTQARVIKEFSTHSRVPEAMLSKAAAESSLGRKSEARATLQRLIKKYPNTDSAKVAKQRLKALPAPAASAKKAK